MFNDILQKSITLVCNNKTLRQGKLLLVSKKDFYITFTMLIKGVTKKYEIPYPYDIIEEEGSIIFDYTNDTLCCGSAKRIDFVSNLATQFSPVKFFNNQIILSYN